MVSGCVETSDDSDSDSGGEAANGGGEAANGGLSSGDNSQGGAPGAGTDARGGESAGEGGRSDEDPAGGQGQGGEPSAGTGSGEAAAGQPAEPGVAGAAGAETAPSRAGSSGAGATESGGSGGGGNPGDEIAQHFFLPTPSSTNTVAPKIAVDRDGGIHAAYPAYVGGRAFYAYCDQDCAGADDVEVVEFEIGDSVANVSLALTESGQPRLVLSEFNQVYYAACDADCTSRSEWTVTPVVDHQSSQEVTGQALALDPEGNPRFLVHTYVAMLGIGQEDPETFLVSCDSGCDDADAWTSSKIADDIWQYPEMRIDGDGRTHVVAAEVTFEAGVPAAKLATHFQCDDDCGTPDSWTSVVLASLYEDTVVKPSLALALTDEGGARVALLTEGADDTSVDDRYLAYAECDGDCAEADWRAVLISENVAIRNGVGIALEGGSPRVAFTLDYNIGIYQCEEDCTDSDWELREVEFANNLPADDIFLFPNCSVGAWFLDSPSISIAQDGAVRVGYRAYDVSGELQPPLDPTKPRCTTGLDFTWSRLAALPAQ